MKIVKFNFTGDILLHSSKPVDPDEVFKGVRHHFGDGEITVVNNESCITERELKPIKHKNALLKSHPDEMRLYEVINASVVSLANNHIGDYGPEGISDTVRIIKTGGFACAGAGNTRQEANDICLFSRDGVRIGILNRTFTCEAANRKIPDTSPQAAELDFNLLKADIRKNRPDCDILIILLHFGYEYCQYPVPEHVKACRDLIEAGADIVAGHHPHVFQGIEKYKGGLIAYSLGNFRFEYDKMNFSDFQHLNIFLKCTCKLKQVNSRFSTSDIEYLPVPVVQRYGKVIDAEGPDRLRILERLEEISSVFDDPGYPEIANRNNYRIMRSVRKKEIISYLAKGDFPYLFKKLKNIRPIHIKMLLSRKKG